MAPPPPSSGRRRRGRDRPRRRADRRQSRCGEPSAMMRPSASTNTCSARLITACITCSIITMVMPRSRDRADHRHHVADLGRVEAGQHLVEQQQPRLDRERARELEPLAAGDRQARGRPVEHARRGRPRARPRRRRPAHRRARGRDRCAPTAMFSRTVRPANGCTIWKVRAMPRRASRCGGTPVMSAPS